MAIGIALASRLCVLVFQRVCRLSKAGPDTAGPERTHLFIPCKHTGFRRLKQGAATSYVRLRAVDAEGGKWSPADTPGALPAAGFPRRERRGKSARPASRRGGTHAAGSPPDVR